MYRPEHRWKLDVEKLINLVALKHVCDVLQIHRLVIILQAILEYLLARLVIIALLDRIDLVPALL